MSTQYPELEDYGVTTKQYERYIALQQHYRSHHTRYCITAEIALTIILIGVVIYSSIYGNLGFAILFGVPSLYFIVDLMQGAILQFRKRLLGGGKTISQIKLYEEEVALYRMILEEDARVQEEAERLRQKKLRDFWMSLSGTEFERELGDLFKRNGWEVQWTPASGDEGVDLILRKDGKKTVVQCKAHKAPVGPAIVRELYGSMVASGADNAILACTGGFTRGVWEFAEDKPIELISASDLMEMADSIDNNMTP